MAKAYRARAKSDTDTPDIGHTADETVGGPVVADYRNNANEEWDPNSIGQAWKEPGTGRPFPQSTKDRNFIPYRGDEPHGVKLDPWDTGDPRTLGTVLDAGTDVIVGTGHPVIGPTKVDDRVPILVETVKEASPKYRREVATNFVPCATLGHWENILHDRPQRTNVVLKVAWTAAYLATNPTGQARVWFTKQSGQSYETGFAMNVGDTLTLGTQERMHAILDPAFAGMIGNVGVSIVEEYEVTIPWVEVDS